MDAIRQMYKPVEDVANELKVSFRVFHHDWCHELLISRQVGDNLYRTRRIYYPHKGGKRVATPWVNDYRIEQVEKAFDKLRGKVPLQPTHRWFGW